MQNPHKKKTETMTTKGTVSKGKEKAESQEKKKAEFKEMCRKRNRHGASFYPHFFILNYICIPIGQMVWYE